MSVATLKFSTALVKCGLYSRLPDNDTHDSRRRTMLLTYDMHVTKYYMLTLDLFDVYLRQPLTRPVYKSSLLRLVPWTVSSSSHTIICPAQLKGMCLPLL